MHFVSSVLGIELNDEKSKMKYFVGLKKMRYGITVRIIKLLNFVRSFLFELSHRTSCPFYVEKSGLRVQAADV